MSRWLLLQGAVSQGYSPPYPLAIITSGFLVPTENYTSYAKRLASWGCVPPRLHPPSAMSPTGQRRGIAAGWRAVRC